MEVTLERSLHGRLDSVLLGWTRHGRLEQVRLYKVCHDPENVKGFIQIHIVSLVLSETIILKRVNESLNTLNPVHFNETRLAF